MLISGQHLLDFAWRNEPVTHQTTVERAKYHYASQVYLVLKKP